jgi:hypothetical protein
MIEKKDEKKDISQFFLMLARLFPKEDMWESEGRGKV